MSTRSPKCEWDMDATRYARSFDVLDLLIGQPAGLRLSDIAKALSVPVSSLHNLLQTMVAAEVLVANAQARYSIGPRTVRIAIRTADAFDIRRIARRHMQLLAERVGDDAYLAVRLGKRVVFAERVQGTQLVSVDIRLGHIWSLHSTSAGKLFAAFDDEIHGILNDEALEPITAATIIDRDLLEEDLHQIRLQGYAVSRGETVADIVGYAFPIRDAAGKLIAALHMSVLRGRATALHERQIIKEARLTTAAIEAELGRSSETPAPARTSKRKSGATQ